MSEKDNCPVSPLSPDLALWGGIECTVNRVGSRYYDQLVWSGHDRRPEDLRRFAELGISALRYPVLWEYLLGSQAANVDPCDAQNFDWSFADERLGLLHELGIRPIVGFLHHGSGPRGTHLMDPRFAKGLAQVAAAFARRYPWVTDYTPINEPLTTARFSGLYGLWYPHRRGDEPFVRALISQCRAIVLAMREIRAVNPAARLIATEDLGVIYSTPPLAYQASFENHRRWLSIDLLSGRVDRQHPLWHYLLDRGKLREAELLEFAEPCPPDIIGINYYLTSDRFLDHRLLLYPPERHGGNGRHSYADVDAVRVRKEGITGHRALLEQAWQRYHLPLAFTEVHLGCTREEQLRWMKEAWDAACSARAAGIDVRAVTAWALLGSSNWNSLVTRDEGYYESGGFDVRAPTPRQTALGTQIAALAKGNLYDHPVLAAPGWWRREDRMYHKPYPPGAEQAAEAPELLFPRGRPILIAGGGGTLGTAFGHACQQRGLFCALLGRGQMDIANPDSVEAALAAHDPWAVINAAGYVRVDQAEREQETCHRENTTGPEVLAAACQSHGVPFLTFSSDLVFDGAVARPYVESDKVAPLSVYGLSKAEAERRVLRRCPFALIVRTSAFFGPWDAHNFVTRALRTLRAGKRLRAARDLMVSPTYVPDLVHACLDLLIDEAVGVWHLVNNGAITWAGLAMRAAELAGCNPRLVEACESASLGLLAPRPRYTVLCSERGPLLPDLAASLGRYLRESAPMWAQAA